ncbi:putative C-S lyase [Alteromonas sediminis]|uniref:cysteine-S-conjugate beta-lyase n=1 Tax=Alteromonas sediminis TaxID=2259342 RepID=A0A3N5XYR8_9ALTE|nr:PatB family C-S lyase [Alteromonas sediminis]RPJ65780.1 putative C-S lyase [Alteromonas sediminis]
MATFPQLPNRKPTFSFKWEKYKGKDILPMWVADSEFACAQPILDALTSRIQHGVLGYTLPAQYSPASDAVVSWLRRRHNWQIKPEWIVWTPGVVPAFNVACIGFGHGDEGKGRVLIQEPNYPPLRAAPGLHNLEKVSIQTRMVDGRLTLDFDQLEAEASNPDTHLMILCNPMNPVGTAMTQSELDRVATICQKYQVTLCSDEIHCDLILDEGTTHLPASAHPALADNSITLMAASKTFNIAGLGTSFAIIPDATLRRRFNQAAAGIEPWANILGLVATEAAFTQCDEWYEQQLTYLRENRALVRDAIDKIPGLTIYPAEATFLAWIDASGLGVDNVQDWCEERGVGPSPGADFGWKHCFRLNFACGRDDLTLALDRLSKA